MRSDYKLAKFFCKDFFALTNDCIARLNICQIDTSSIELTGETLKIVIV
jgi:hypothetical protein